MVGLELITKKQLKMELIAEQVELADNKLNDNDFDIFYNNETKLIHAFENNETENVREFVYELTENQDDISTKHREEILSYCLSSFNDDDEVSLADIFIHGKYVRRIC
jgi:hypothetical protein